MSLMLHEMLVIYRNSDALINVIKTTASGPTASSVTLPAGIISGDLITLNCFSANKSSYPTPTAMTGWTVFGPVTGLNSTGLRSSTFDAFKIANGTESGTIVTHHTGTLSNVIDVRVYRKMSGVISSFNVIDYQVYMDPAPMAIPKTINLLSGVQPFFSFLRIGCGGPITQNFQYSLTGGFFADTTNTTNAGFINAYFSSESFYDGSLVPNKNYQMNLTSGATQYRSVSYIVSVT